MDSTASVDAARSVGVIGLGIIGSVWAKHYANAGVLVASWNRSAKPDVPKPVAGAREVRPVGAHVDAAARRQQL